MLKVRNYIKFKNGINSNNLLFLFNRIYTSHYLYNFDFGDGTFIDNDSVVYHQYDGSGVYIVTLTIVSDKGCNSEISKETEVYENPVIDFMITEFCLGTSTYFSNHSYVNDGDIVVWDWDFGDGLGGSNIKDPTYRFNNMGTYKISLSAISSQGCSQEEEKSI